MQTAQLPAARQKYIYGKYANVRTSRELEDNIFKNARNIALSQK